MAGIRPTGVGWWPDSYPVPTVRYHEHMNNKQGRSGMSMLYISRSRLVERRTFFYFLARINIGIIRRRCRKKGRKQEKKTNIIRRTHLSSWIMVPPLR